MLEFWVCDSSSLVVGGLFNLILAQGLEQRERQIVMNPGMISKDETFTHVSPAMGMFCVCGSASQQLFCWWLSVEASISTSSLTAWQSSCGLYHPWLWAVDWHLVATSLTSGTDSCAVCHDGCVQLLVPFQLYFMPFGSRNEWAWSAAARGLP